MKVNRKNLINKQNRKLPNYMEQSPTREANRSSASQQIPPHFMKPESSLPHPHKLVTCPYPDPDQPNLCPPSHFLKIHFNIILPSRPLSCTWSISSRFSHPNPLCALSRQAQSKAYICPFFLHNQLIYNYYTHYHVK